MDTRHLYYYERELMHLREMGGEFAKEFPKIAGRLGLENYACADPYVERLLEGFSFLAARIQLKIDAEFPRFTNHLLELVYPQYLAPTPSMAVVQIQPDLSEGSLAEGFKLERGTALRSQMGKGDQTSCEFRTAHEVTLWPIELVEAKYFTWSGEVGGVEITRMGKIKAGLRLRVKVTAGLKFNEIALDCLTLYLRGSDALPNKMLEQFLSNAAGMIVMPVKQPAAWHKIIAKKEIRACGFTDEEALLPCGARGFHGYRLLHEYFTFPQRYQFIELAGLAPALQACNDDELDIVVLFNQIAPSLEQVLSSVNFSLFCTPVINLFPKRADRIHLSDKSSEYHVVPDRTRPIDYEVYQVLGVKGYGTGIEAEQSFQPFYAANDLQPESRKKAYYQIRRTQRLLSERQRREGPRSSYIGSDVFLSLVDAAEAPYSSNLRQLGIETLCTNRDLVMSMPVGLGKTDFTVESSAPVLSVRCVAGPTIPAPSFAEGETAWRLVNHLTLNYLSLFDDSEKDGASALRELLRLYCPLNDLVAQGQIEGVRSVAAQSIVRRLPVPGPITYGRGLQVTLTLEDSSFDGSSAFLLGAVLEQFFAKYVSLNSFTETVVKTTRRGEIMKWPARVGLCAIL
jgi:type VI secretion system protein ImpG